MNTSQTRNRFLLLFGAPHAAVLSVVFGLFLASFPMGIFVVFSTDIGNEINYNLPITHTSLFENTSLYLAASPMTLGDAFVVLWVFYLVIFAIAALGPVRGFGTIINQIVTGRHFLQPPSLTSQPNKVTNYMHGAIMWFSILVLCSIVITISQDSIGIETIPPESDNRLVEFFYITLAPLLEETGFRLFFVGIPVFLIYATKFSFGYFVRSLWHPALHLDILHDSKKALLIIVIVGIMFGFSHIALGESWSDGKFAQATASGIIIGWAYVRYGFITAIIVHWAANYFVFSHAHFISQTHFIVIEDAFSHAMIASIEIILITSGILSILAMIVSYRYRNVQSI